MEPERGTKTPRFYRLKIQHLSVIRNGAVKCCGGCRLSTLDDAVNEDPSMNELAQSIFF